MDDFIFSHNGANGAESIRQQFLVEFARWQHRSTAAPSISEANSTMSDCLVIIIRPHRKSQPTIAAYCYTLSSVVGLSVWKSGCLSIVMFVRPAKTAEPIDMPFEVVTEVDPRNHVLDVRPDPPRKRTFLEREVAAHCKVYTDTLR